MKLVRIKAVARKEIIQIRRDRLSLAMGFLMPIILLFIYGFAVSFDVEKIDTVVYDMDKGSLSRELVNEFSQSGYFTVLAYVDRYEELDYWLDRGKAKVAIAIPVDFSKRVRAGKDAAIEVILDGSNSNTASIAQGYILSISEAFPRRLGGGKITPFVDSRSRVWYNTELKSRNFIIPGLIAVIMAVIVALLTSLTVAREWDRGTMEQLISTPVKPAELVIGKLIPYFIIGLIDTVLTILMSTLLFHVPLRGSLPLLLTLSSIFLFGGLSTGILISIVAKSQVIASQMAMLNSFLPAFLLSGFIFSISNMPAPLQVVTYIIPARYFVTILKGIFLKGVPFNFLLWETTLLAGYGLAVFILAIKKLKKRID
ncbi:MAG TPA: ABC transporter permease [Syntrophorhabdaceae bacterium]|jgi:ABC-2 type transport system permease protein